MVDQLEGADPKQSKQHAPTEFSYSSCTARSMSAFFATPNFYEAVAPAAILTGQHIDRAWMQNGSGRRNTPC